MTSRLRSPVMAQNRRLSSPSIEPATPRPGFVSRVFLRSFRLFPGTKILIRLGGLGLFSMGVWSASRLVERSVRQSSTFAIRTLEVVGNRHLMQQEVARLAGLGWGHNVFDVTPNQAKARLERNAWIASAKVTRRLPNTYRIGIREHTPVLILALGSLYLVGNDGVVFKKIEDADPVDFPVFTGLDAGRFVEDVTYRTEAIHSALSLLQAYEAAGLSNDSRTRISELHMESDGELSMYVGDSLTYVQLGHGSMATKLSRFREVLAHIRAQRAFPSHLRFYDAPRSNWVAVRMRNSSSEAP